MKDRVIGVRSIRRARRCQWCHWCAERIEQRCPYVRRTMISEGVFYSYGLHPECNSALERSDSPEVAESGFWAFEQVRGVAEGTEREFWEDGRVACDQGEHRKIPDISPRLGDFESWAWLKGWDEQDELNQQVAELITGKEDTK